MKRRCGRVESQRELHSEGRARVQMPWDEGLVNSLVYDRPIRPRGASCSYAAGDQRGAGDWRSSTIRACSCLARASTIRRAMFGTTQGLQRAIRAPIASSIRRCPKKAMMGVSHRRRDERHAARVHAQPAGLRAAGVQPARHPRRRNFISWTTARRPCRWSSGRRSAADGDPARSTRRPFTACCSACPGLKIVMPSTPYDAKGLLLSAILDNNPGLRLRASLADEEGRHRAGGRLPGADRQGHLPPPRTAT